MTRGILRALIPLFVVIVAATLGYWLIWDWSFLDALYMVAITVGTIGFREVHPLTASGQLFTIVVIVAGIVAGGYALTRVFNLLLEGQLQGYWEARRMNKRIEELSGHTILAGLGRVGSSVASALEHAGQPFVVVDQSEECVDSARAGGWLAIQGNATDEDVLMSAGILRAGSVVTALDTDAENLFVTVMARDLHPELFIVARSSHENNESKMLKAGANRVLTPNVIAGRRMATMVMHPTVSDYLDLVTHGSGVEFRLQEVEVPAGSPLVDRTIGDMRVRERTGAYVLAVRHRDGRIDTNPTADTEIHAGDRLVVLGTGSQVDSLAREV